MPGGHSNLMKTQTPCFEDESGHGDVKLWKDANTREL